MPPIRVLLVDDSVVIRRLLTDVLGGDPELEVAAVAANGRIALAKLPQVAPDVVVLDVEMPEMNGLETLAAIRRSHPRLPVIMFSTLTERGATVTLDALSLGASDYSTKPANVGSVGLGKERIREDLIPKIKALAGRSRPTPRTEVGRASLPVLRDARAVRPSIVAIGVSTGGPNALAQLLPQLPADFPVPIVIVQHMPPLFTRFLAERLDGKSRLAVREGVSGVELRPGTVWIAPGDHHLVVERSGTAVVLRTHQGPLENSCRPAVDVLFRSIATVFGAGALGLVLTGMGQDGLRGSEAILHAGGRVLAQDEATSIVWGMPGLVATAGLADRVLPLDLLAAELMERVGGGTSRAVAARPLSRPA